MKYSKEKKQFIGNVRKSDVSEIKTKNQSKRNWQNYTLPGLILLITFIVYYKTIFYGFIYNWDDTGYILNNEFIRSLSFENLKLIFSKFYMHNYHPLTTLTYALEYSFVKTSPWLYHLNNILLHCFNIILVFWFVKLLLKGKEIPALLVSALFALHPMHVESVAWISERKDVLYAFFYLLSLIYYLKYVRNNKRSGLFLSFVFFLLSCLSKSAAVTLPLILFALDYFERRKPTFLLFLEKLPFFLFSVLLGILAIRSQDTAIQDLTPLLTYFERLLIVSYGFLMYLWKAILPIQQSAFYPYPLKVNDMLPWYYFLAPAILVVFGFLLLFSLRKSRIIMFGFLFFLFSISLVLQLVPVGGAIIAERYTYIPYIGLFLILILPLSGDAKKGLSQKLQKIYLPFLILVITVFSIQTYERTKLWKDGDVLFSDVLESYPKFPYAYNNRGFLYFDHYALKVYSNSPVMKEKYVSKAYSDYTKAIQLNPAYVQAYANRAVLLYNTGKPHEALDDFNKLLQLAPTHKDGLIGRANTLSSIGKYEESLQDYNAYIEEKKDEDYKAYMWRGIAFLKTGKFKNAENDFLKANNLNKDDFEPYYWQGLLEYQNKNFSKAIEYLNVSISKNPKHFESYSWRGLSYFYSKQYPEAIRDYTTAIELKPQDLSNFVNRSLAYNELKDYKKAFEDLDYAGRRGQPINKEYFEKLYRLGFAQ